MNLILVKQSEQSKDGSITLPPLDPRALHITKHLRKQSGATVAVGIIDNYRCTALVELLADGVSLTPQGETIVYQRKEPEITLVLAMPFPSRMRWLWPVISSFAYVTRVVVVQGALTDAEFCESTCLQPAVYMPLIEKGMGQGVRTRSIKVDICLEHVSETMLKQFGFNDLQLPKVLLDCGDEKADPEPLHGAIRSYASGVYPDGLGVLVLAIGPERGWTEKEANIFHEFGFISTTLGSSILRVDAAVVGALSVATSALDQEWAFFKRLKEEECERSEKRAKTN